jgi:hypothetical protein
MRYQITRIRALTPISLLVVVRRQPEHGPIGAAGQCTLPQGEVISVLTVKNLCWGQNQNSVLWVEKKRGVTREKCATRNLRKLTDGTPA